MPENTDPFKWGKFFKGVVDPKLTAKLSAFIIHIGLWAALVFGVIFTFNLIKNTLKKPQPPVQIETNSGHVETNSDRRTKFGVINF